MTSRQLNDGVPADLKDLVFCAVKKNPYSTAHELAELMCIPAAAARWATRELEKAGLIVRERPLHFADRWVAAVKLIPEEPREKTTGLTFDWQPRGYTSVNRYEGSMHSYTSWLEPRFRAAAVEASAQLEPQLAAATRAQLVAFLARAGQQAWAGQKKRDLEVTAYLAQVKAWYPDKEMDPRTFS